MRECLDGDPNAGIGPVGRDGLDGGVAKGALSEVLHGDIADGGELDICVYIYCKCLQAARAFTLTRTI